MSQNQKPECTNTSTLERSFVSINEEYRKPSTIKIFHHRKQAIMTLKSVALAPEIEETQGENWAR
ncbi:predicted protein [Botrytis cinerea T4]|uniref:Uncharacterized protein n=1 Tax=Botryotinia fuckeliana (strain T4) TaxID=999810 RepID=G2Y1V0_BOTF4|nr:predicted protein [Botrytis cinerea T4]